MNVNGRNFLRIQMALREMNLCPECCRVGQWVVYKINADELKIVFSRGRIGAEPCDFDTHVSRRRRLDVWSIPIETKVL